jgi:hypothetical protein
VTAIEPAAFQRARQGFETEGLAVGSLGCDNAPVRKSFPAHCGATIPTRALATIVGVAMLWLPGRAAAPQRPTLDSVLQRGRQTAQRYGDEAALLLADESCSQTLFASKWEAGKVPQGYGGTVMQRIDPKARRSWQAVLALARTPELAASGHPWIEVRDVVNVDGQQRPDREDRLSRFFLKLPEWTLEKARAIGDESGRYNIGPIIHDVSTPSAALLVLHGANDGRFALSKGGEQSVGPIKAWKIDYRERGKPYLVGGDGDAACASSGTLWVDPATGDVLRSVLQCGTPGASLVKLTVQYSPDARWHLCLPAEMLVKAESDSGMAWVDGKYTYANYRRFETSGHLVVPK